MSYNYIAEVYSESFIPVIISDLKCNILWGNSVYKNFKGKANDKKLSTLIGSVPENSGLYYFRSEGLIYTYNVIVTKKFIIAEQISSVSAADIFNMPAVQDYLSYIYSVIRNTVNSVTVAADEIYAANDKAKSGGETIFECLNTIDGAASELLSEILDAETLIILAGSTDKEKTVCISDSLEKLTSDTKKILRDKVRVRTDIEKAVYAVYNKSSFNVLISDLVASCLDLSGAADSVSFSLKRIDNNRISITISSVTGRNPENAAHVKNKANVKNSMYSQYVCDSFCKKYNCEFSKLSSENEIVYKLELPAISGNQPVVSRSYYYENVNSRFSAVSLRLMKYRANQRYAGNEEEYSLPI